MGAKLDEVLNYVKANDYLKRKEEEKKKASCHKTICMVLTVVGIIAAVAAIAYALYRYFTPDYLEDFEDDFDDDFDDDFFEDEENDEEVTAAKPESTTNTAE